MRTFAVELAAQYRIIGATVAQFNGPQGYIGRVACPQRPCHPHCPRLRAAGGARPRRIRHRLPGTNHYLSSSATSLLGFLGCTERCVCFQLSVQPSLFTASVASTWQAIETSSGRVVAIKVVPKDDMEAGEEEVADMEEEIAQLLHEDKEM